MKIGDLALARGSRCRLRLGGGVPIARRPSSRLMTGGATPGAGPVGISPTVGWSVSPMAPGKEQAQA